jgi:simple sugar transport system substrate-binding protein
VALCVAAAVAGAYWLARTEPPAPGRFGGMRIVFIMGGEPGQDFAEGVHGGVLAARRDLGVNVLMKWTHWDAQRLLTQFRGAMDLQPDGICVIGFPGQEYLPPLIEEARRLGILVTSINTPILDMPPAWQRDGFGFVGQDGKAAGRRLAAKAVEMFGLAPGARALVLGSRSVMGRGLRAEGCVEALQEAGIAVDYGDVPQRQQGDGGWPVRDLINERLDSGPAPAVIINDTGAAAEVADALRARGLRPGEVAVAGFDLSPDNLAAIRDGYVGLLLDQQEFLQGYLAVLQICLAHEWAITGLNIETSGVFVDASNAERYAEIAARRRD